MEEVSFFIQNYSLVRLCIIHPFSFKHGVAIAIVLNASSPALSRVYHSFIFWLLDVRVVPSAVAHILFANLESLVHPSVLTVIQHAPTIRLIVQNVALPSLSIITQIQHLIRLDVFHHLSIHS